MDWPEFYKRTIYVGCVKYGVSSRYLPSIALRIEYFTLHSVLLTLLPLERIYLRFFARFLLLVVKVGS